MNIIYKLVLTITIFSFFSGCNSTTSSATETEVNTQSTVGYLIDANVSGVEYEGINCEEPVSGITGSDDNKSGVFVFNYSCESLEFKIGGVTLGDILVTDINTTDYKVFITDLADKDRNDTNNSSVKNIVRLLQTLDDDEYPFNGIFITKQMRDKVVHTETMKLENENYSETDLANILVKNDINRTLVTSIKALVHFEDTLRDNGVVVDTVPPYQPYIESLPKATKNDKTYLEIHGEKNAYVYLNGVTTNQRLDDNGTLEELELDTNITIYPRNTFVEYNLTLVDDQNRSSEPLEIRLFMDTQEPSIDNLVSNAVNAKTITAPSKYIMDFEVTDNSLDFNLSLTYEILGEHKDYFRFVSSALYFIEEPTAGVYNIGIKVIDEAKHEDDANLTITVN